MSFLAGLGSGLGSAIGGIAGGLLGGNKGGHSYQYYLDRDFNQAQRIAKNQPSWLVEGAKNAGLHPLAVMGMNIASGPSHYVGDQGGGGKDYSWLQDAGQGIGRAAGALLSKEDRAKQQAYDEARQSQQLENNQLQNELLRTQTAQIKQDMAMQLARDSTRALNNSGQTPGFQVGVDGRVTRSIIDGQNNAVGSSLFEVKPAEIVANDPQRISAEAGSVPEVRFARTSDGGYAPVRSTAMEEALEDDFWSGAAWQLRNRLAPILMDWASAAPPDSFSKDNGGTWIFNIPKQAWYKHKLKRWYDYPKAKYLP